MAASFQAEGIANDGVSCYAIGVLQLLFNVPEIRQLIETLEELRPLRVWLTRYSHGTINISHFRRSFGAPWNNDTEQQDAVEFFDALFERYPTILDAIRFQAGSRMTCGICKPIPSAAFEMNRLLTIGFRVDSGRDPTMADLLAHYLAKTSDHHVCRGVPGKSCSTWNELRSLQNIFLIHIQYFTSDGSIKRSPHTLDLSQPDFELMGEQFTIRAVILHDGPTQNSGHYTTAVRHVTNGQWFLLDNTAVHTPSTNLPGKGLGKGRIYVCVAVKMSPGQQHSGTSLTAQPAEAPIEMITLDSDEEEMEPMRPAPRHSPRLVTSVETVKFAFFDI